MKLNDFFVIRQNVFASCFKDLVLIAFPIQ